MNRILITLSLLGVMQMVQGQERDSGMIRYFERKTEFKKAHSQQPLGLSNWYDTIQIIGRVYEVRKFSEFEYTMCFDKSFGWFQEFIPKHYEYLLLDKESKYMGQVWMVRKFNW